MIYIEKFVPKSCGQKVFRQSLKVIVLNVLAHYRPRQRHFCPNDLVRVPTRVIQQNRNWPLCHALKSLLSTGSWQPWPSWSESVPVEKREGEGKVQFFERRRSRRSLNLKFDVELSYKSEGISYLGENSFARGKRKSGSSPPCLDTLPTPGVFRALNNLLIHDTLFSGVVLWPTIAFFWRKSWKLKKV